MITPQGTRAPRPKGEPTMRSVHDQQNALKRALHNGIKTYRDAIAQKVGAYDQEAVTTILSQPTFEEMWYEYTHNDTLVRDYVMTIVC